MKMRNVFSAHSDGPDYQIACPSFMASFIWGTILMLAVVAGSFMLSCVAPLCALAVALAATLGLRTSLVIMTFVWLVNQAVGFTLFHFPRTANSALWGLAIGIAAVLITMVARAMMRSTSSWNALLRLIVALAVTFAAYELLLWAAAFVLGGRDMFSVAILMQVALVNTAWLGAIIALNEIVAALCKPWLGRIPMVVRSSAFS
jgi:hypothetical protein